MTPWLWTVLQQSDPDVSTVSHVSAESHFAAFFHLMTQLPSSAIVTCRQSPTLSVCGLDQLLNAVNNVGRNMTNTLTLSAELTLHLVATLAQLPDGVGNDVDKFLHDCPLLTVSATVHHVIIRNAVDSVGGTVGGMIDRVCSLVDEVSSWLDGGSQRSTAPAWLCGVALWARINSSQYSVDTCRLVLERDVSESLLHCLTVDMASRMLYGDDSWHTVEDCTLTLWLRYTDCLHCLTDHPLSPVASVFRLCVSDVLGRVQPLACLRLFVRVACDTVDVDMTRLLRWYSDCVQMFDCATCSLMPVMTVIRQASQAICSLALSMSRSQIDSVDQATLDTVDPHIRCVFHQLRNS